MEERINQLPVQLEERNGNKWITGYAAVWYNPLESGTEYQIGANCWERLTPRAFDHVLANRQRVQVRYNHSKDFLLGDTESGAELRTDSRGLRYSLPFDSENPDHLKIKSLIKNNLIKGSSIGFKPVYRWAEENGRHVGYVDDVSVLRDVSPCSEEVAYPATGQVAIRSAEADESYQNWLKQKDETDALINQIETLDN